MKTNKLMAMLLALSLAAPLSGCAQTSRTAGTAISGASQTPAPTAAASDSGGNDARDGVDASTIVIYSPHDADPLNACITNFMEKYPDIKVKLVAGGTGELCERIKSEADSPQADVFWGGGADSMEAYSQYFEKYVSPADKFIDEKFKDPDDKWTGESPLPMVIIYNKKLLAEAGLQAPQSWEDCLNPAFRGKIAYCQPSKSGSAYTQLCTMILANGGGEEGWKYVEKFAANLGGKILDSSGKCHKLVSSGEYMIGITIEKSAALYSGDENIGYCYPSEGTSAVPDSVAIVKGCLHRDNARLFVDFVLSAQSQSEQSKDWSRRPSRSDTAAPEGLADMDSIKLVDYDFNWAAANKSAFISRFDSLLSGG
jgi:iron(III) transport system substrate-binding protein